jgi:hypothetical protein
MAKNQPPTPQLEFFFMNKANTLVGQNWRSGFSVAGGQDSVYQAQISLAVGTQMSSYWPSTVFQDSTGKVNECLYFYGNASVATGFVQRATPVSGSSNSPLLVLPREAQYSAGKAVNSSSTRIFYRSTSGVLSVYDKDASGVQQSTSG